MHLQVLRCLISICYKVDLSTNVTVLTARLALFMCASGLARRSVWDVGRRILTTVMEMGQRVAFSPWFSGANNTKSCNPSTTFAAVMEDKNYWIEIQINDQRTAFVNLNFQRIFWCMHYFFWKDEKKNRFLGYGRTGHKSKYNEFLNILTEREVHWHFEV